jgi:type IV secretion system protein VirB10
MLVARFANVLAISAMCLAQDAPILTDPITDPPVKEGKQYSIAAGTRILVTVINTTSTKNAQPGDWVYLETSFPVATNGRIVIPAGTYVTGTVTRVERPGRVKGKGELGVRFDTLMLANGTTRDFRATPAGLDGNAPGRLDKEEGVIVGEGNKGGDAQTVGRTTGIGAGVGGIAGIGTNPGMGAGIGAAAGALGGLIGVLASRGPEAMLAKGTQLQMVLDRDLTFYESELMPVGVVPSRVVPTAPGAPANRQGQRVNRVGIPGIGGIPRF